MAVVNVVGATVSVAWRSSDDASATLTVTLPDGTTVAGAVSDTATSHTATFTASQAGLYRLHWETAEDQHSGVLEVWPEEPRLLVSEQDLLKRIKESTANPGADALDALPVIIAASTEVVENISGPILPDTKSWTESGKRRQRKVVLPDDNVTITSVTVDDVALDSSDYVLEYDSIVVSDSFTEGDANITISYTVGSWTSIPQAARLACIEIAAHMWTIAYQGGRPDAVGEVEVTPQGFAIPRRAVELLRTLPRPAGLA